MADLVAVMLLTAAAFVLGTGLAGWLWGAGEPKAKPAKPEYVRPMPEDAKVDCAPWGAKSDMFWAIVIAQGPRGQRLRARGVSKEPDAAIRSAIRQWHREADAEQAAVDAEAAARIAYTE